jgi:hypothetical protein
MALHMKASSQLPLISVRVPVDTKRRFAGLALKHSKTESRLLLELIEAVLQHNGEAVSDEVTREGCSERLSLRLRPGDRALLEARAAARRMKVASYAVALIRAHVRRQAPLPMVELNELKLVVARLAALERTLRAISIGTDAVGGGTAQNELVQLLRDARRHAEDVRHDVASVVRTHLLAWEVDEF